MRKLFKVLLYLALVLVVLAVLAVVLVSTSWFWQSQILPRVSQAAGMPVTVEKISFSPFTRLEMANLRVGPDAEHPLVQGRLLRCRYSVLALFKGELKVNELLVDGFKVEMLQDAKGNWNYPTPPASSAEKPAAAPAAGGPPTPPAWPNLNNIEIRDFTFTMTQAAPDGNGRRLELKNFNLKLPVVRRGTAAVMTWDGDLLVEQGQEVSVTGAKLSGTLTADLDGRFQPKSVKLQTGIGGLAGRIQTVPLAGHEVQVEIVAANAGPEWRITTCRFEEKLNGTPEAVANLSAVITPTMKTVHLNDFSAKIVAAGNNLVDLQLSAPLDVAWGSTTGAPLTAAPAKLEIKINRLPLMAANPFLPPASGARLDAGTFSAAILAEIADLGQAIHITGTTTVDDLGGQAAGQVFKNIGVKKEFDVSLSGFRKLEVTRQETTVTVAGEPALRLAVKGQLDLQDLTGRFTGQLPLCNEKLLVVLPGAAQAAAWIKRLQVNAEWDASLEAKGKRISVTAQVNVPELEARNPEDGKTLPLLQAKTELAIEADLNTGKLMVNKLSSALTADRQPLLEVKMTRPAEINWGKTGAAGTPTAEPAVVQVLVKQFDLQLLNPFLPPSAQARIQSGTLSAEISATIGNLGRELRLNGMVEGAGITVTVKTETIRNAGFKNRFEVECLDFQQVKISGTELELLNAKDPVLTAAVTGQYDLKTQAGEFKFRMPLCTRKVLDLVPGAGQAAGMIKRLEAQAEITAGIADNANRITAAGTLTAPVLELTMPDGKALPAMKATLAFALKQVDLKQQTIEIATLDAGLAETTRQLVELHLTRPALISWAAPTPAADKVSQTELKFKINSLALPLLNPFLAAQKISILGGILDVDLSVTAGRLGQELQAAGEIKVSNLDLTTPQAAIKDLVLQENLDISVRDFRTIEIRRLETLATLGGKHLADLAVKGNFELPPAKAESVLTVTSKEIDGRVIGGLFAGGDSSVAPALPPESVPGPVGEPPPVDLKGLWLTLNLDLAKISYGEVLVSAFKSQIRIKDNKVAVEPLDFGLNGTPVHFSVAADLNQPGYTYKVDGKFAGLNLAPFVATFAPKMRDNVSGMIQQFELNLAGAGITPRNLQKNFTGRVVLKGEKIGLQNLPALDTVADIWDVPELKQLRFETADFLLQSEDGLMKIKEGTIVGPDLMLSLTGGITFDQRLDLKARIGVCGAIETRMYQNQLGLLLDKKEGKYTMFNVDYPITGTLSRPVLPEKKALLQQAAVKAGKKVFFKGLDAAIKAQAEGKSVNLKDILNSVTQAPATATTPATGTGTTPATPAAPATNTGVGNLLNLLGEGAQPAPAAGTAPAATPAPAPATGKKAKNEALKELGTGLLNNFLQGK